MMDRRNFIKASLCLGCAAAVGYGCISAYRKINSEGKPENKFLYNSEKDLPKIVRLEACNDCQLNCPACGIRQAEQEIIEKGGGFGYLKFEDFKNFVDKHSFIKEIELSNNGEIFLNPELDDIIRYAYEKGITLTAYNGVNLNTVSEKTLENLVKYKFSGMSVSIDGATPETYKIYRRGGDLNTVLNNIRIINRFKKQYNSSYPYLSWQYIVFGHNEHEIDKAKELAKELEMDIRFIANESPEYSPVHDPKMIEEKTGIKFVNNCKSNNALAALPADIAGTVDYAEEENSLENVENDGKVGIIDNDGGAVYCRGLSEAPQINFNGDLLGCCILSFENFNVNVFKEGLMNTLNSSQVTRAKLMLSDFSVEPFADIPCSRCGTYYDLKKENHTVKFPETNKV